LAEQLKKIFLKNNKYSEETDLVCG